MKSSSGSHLVGSVGLVLGILGSGGCDTVASSSAVDQGQHQFQNYCQPCHEEGGVGNPDIAAPAIAGLPEWYISDQLHDFRDGLRGSNFADIEGFRMRPMALALRSERDIANVTAYVASLPRTYPAPTLEGGVAANGANSWALCAQCHGEKGKGVERDAPGLPALGGPPLVGTHDWYLYSQLEKIKGGTRGGDVRDDEWALSMVTMSQTLPDEQAMLDVVAYIQTLR